MILCMHMNGNALTRHITIQQPEDHNPKNRKTYDIEGKDFFWNKNASNPFPQVAGDYYFGRYMKCGLSLIPFCRGY